MMQLMTILMKIVVVADVVGNTLVVVQTDYVDGVFAGCVTVVVVVVG